MSKKIFKIDKDFNKILRDIGNYNPENKIPISNNTKRIDAVENRDINKNIEKQDKNKNTE